MEAGLAEALTSAQVREWKEMLMLILSFCPRVVSTTMCSFGRGARYWFTSEKIRSAMMIHPIRLTGRVKESSRDEQKSGHTESTVGGADTIIFFDFGVDVELLNGVDQTRGSAILLLLPLRSGTVNSFHHLLLVLPHRRRDVVPLLLRCSPASFSRNLTAERA
jgi:hypothetical protein